MPREIYNALIEGLQKLLVLRLRGAPAADSVVAVAAIWEEALCHSEGWRVEDLPRMRKAFAQLYADCREWPSPRNFLERLPPRPPPPALPNPPISPERRAALRKILSDLTLKLTEPEHARPKSSRNHRQTQ